MKTLLLLLLLAVGSSAWVCIHSSDCPPDKECKDGKCEPWPQDRRRFSFKTVSGGEVCIPECAEGSVCKDGKCESVSRRLVSTTCPPGQIFVGGRCVGRRDFSEPPCPPGMIMGPAGVCILKPSGFDFDSFNQDRCPPGQIFVGGRCVGRPNRHFVPPCPIGWILDAHGNCVEKPAGFYFDSFNQNPCRPGQVLVGGRCVGIPDRFFFGTCTTSLECPDNRKCVDGICLAV